jgi:hypothetical protein
LFFVINFNLCHKELYERYFRRTIDSNVSARRRRGFLFENLLKK